MGARKSGGFMDTVVRVTPFQVGWKVVCETPGGRGIETVTGRREVALQVAQYQAERHNATHVVVLREDGSVDDSLDHLASAV
jgi:hypothetical protein